MMFKSKNYWIYKIETQFTMKIRSELKISFYSQFLSTYFVSQKYKVDITVNIDEFFSLNLDWCVLLQYCQDLGPEEFEIGR